jgi:hypothetical protein
MPSSPEQTPWDIACQQVLQRDASVYSIQWMTIPPSLARDISPDFLLQRYFAFLRRVTGTLVRPLSGADGVSFRLAGTDLSLISFLPPHVELLDGERTLSLMICGGFLVQSGAADRGVLTFGVAQEKEGVRLTLRLTDFCPLILGSNRPSRLRKWLYRLTQAYIHRMVTVRFLAGIYRELAGRKACVRVVKAQVVEGEPI